MKLIEYLVIIAHVWHNKTLCRLCSVSGRVKISRHFRVLIHLAKGEATWRHAIIVNNIRTLTDTWSERVFTVQSLAPRRRFFAGPVFQKPKMLTKADWIKYFGIWQPPKRKVSCSARLLSRMTKLPAPDVDRSFRDFGWVSLSLLFHSGNIALCMCKR